MVSWTDCHRLMSQNKTDLAKKINSAVISFHPSICLLPKGVTSIKNNYGDIRTSPEPGASSQLWA